MHEMKKAGRPLPLQPAMRPSLSQLILRRGFLVFLLHRKLEGEQRDDESIHELSFLDGGRGQKRKTLARIRSFRRGVKHRTKAAASRHQKNKAGETSPAFG
jgi:hypothetical protein